MSGPLVVVGGWVCEDTGTCTCGTGTLPTGHEPGCGLEPLYRTADQPEDR